MGSGSVPVTLKIFSIVVNFSRQHSYFSAYLHGLGIETDNNSEVLGDPEEEVAGHPEIIPHVDTDGGPHLESKQSYNAL